MKNFLESYFLLVKQNISLYFSQPILANFIKQISIVYSNLLQQIPLFLQTFFNITVIFVILISTIVFLYNSWIIFLRFIRVKKEEPTIFNMKPGNMTGTQLEEFLVSLRNDLTNFKKEVESMSQRESQERKQLQIELSKIYSLSSTMNQETLNLTRALKGDFKLQGKWGEVVLENILNSCGLRKGHEYDAQLSFPNKENPNLFFRPDIVVHLPGGRHIIIDSKVSLNSYYDYVSLNNTTEEDVKAYAKKHLNALYKHISDLSKKHYEKLYSNSLDYVLMFVPLESAFVEAIKHDREFLDKAINQKVIVVSPTTLLATLKTIEIAWKHYKITENTSLIYSKASIMTEKITTCLSDLDKLGKDLIKLQQSYDKIVNNISVGRGSLLQELKLLEEMGVSQSNNIPERFSANPVYSDDPQVLAKEEKDSFFFNF